MNGVNQQFHSAEAAYDRLRAELCAVFGRPRPLKRWAISTTIKHYQLQKKIGAGARGTVYLANDRRSGEFVAIKVLRRFLGVDSRRRFLREAECAWALNHPNAVKVHELLHEQGLDLIVMEYVPGTTLDRVIPKRGLPLRTCLDYALQVAGALSAIHSKQMIHRDLKPANFIVAESGSVILLDFGLAKVVPGARPCQSGRKGLIQTHEGTIVGTPGYMSPEQVRGQAADERSDIFGFGAIFYEMLTGRPAFREDSPVETMAAILNNASPSLPTRIPMPVARILQRCLAKEPKRRYRTAIPLLAALRRVSQTQSSSQ